MRKNKSIHCKPETWILIRSEKLTILLIFLILSSWGCTQTIPEEYTGSWVTGKCKITVRYKSPGDEHSRYITDSAVVSMTIQADKTAIGFIGSASFESSKIKKNFSLPWENGVKYIIKCSTTGKIFDADPQANKEVDLWLGPVKDQQINATLRKGGTNFSMADLIFEKK